MGGQNMRYYDFLVAIGAMMVLAYTLVGVGVAHPDHGDVLGAEDGQTEAGTQDADNAGNGYLIADRLGLEDVGWPGIAVFVLAIVIALSSIFFILYSIREAWRAFA